MNVVEMYVGEWKGGDMVCQWHGEYIVDGNISYVYNTPSYVALNSERTYWQTHYYSQL